MNKEIKDYLHLYLGCNVQFKGQEKKGKINTDNLWQLVSVHQMTYKKIATIEAMGCVKSLDPEDIKPILRPLSDMNEDDCPAWFKVWMPDGFIVLHQYDHNFHYIEIDSNAHDGYCLIIHSDGSMNCECKDNGEQYGYRGAELFAHFLSIQFDLFGLINSGLAIDKTKIK